MPPITSHVPSTFLKPDAWEHVRQLQLGDPTFVTSGEIIILLGAEIFPQLLTGKKITGPLRMQIAFDMVLGWVPMGHVKITQICSKVLRSSSHMFIEGCTPADSEPVLGDSASSILCLFHSLECRLRKQPKGKADYVAFMQDYLAAKQINHLKKVTTEG
ncbi:hypothetical protein PR048_018628 [Dryococelus australis]|uniref:Peptidase aspartic putative domain-containing protein n=1 Tax=Dryococelus australis TaxID=614101 RepID=A0ABQ9HCY5_9NEOP|nr:hypothetical protein PR048_018628 [Dryococelus australis]